MLAGGKLTSNCDPCHNLHGKPECFETTAFFYDGVTGLHAAKEEIEKRASELAELGMEVDDLRFNTAELGDLLLQSRSLIHSFNRTDFSRPYSGGMKLAAELTKQSEEMRQEYRFRRTWLVGSTLVITAFALILYLRIKVADREGGYRPPGA